MAHLDLVEASGHAIDAVTRDRSQLAARRTVFTDPDAHVILDVVMSKEPLGPVVPHYQRS